MLAIMWFGAVVGIPASPRPTLQPRSTVHPLSTGNHSFICCTGGNLTASCLESTPDDLAYTLGVLQAPTTGARALYVNSTDDDITCYARGFTAYITQGECWKNLGLWLEPSAAAKAAVASENKDYSANGHAARCAAVASPP